MAVYWYESRGTGLTGRSLSREAARLTPTYLTLSAEFHEEIGAPDRLMVGYDPDAPFLVVKPPDPGQESQAMAVGKHGENRKSEHRRRRVNVATPLRFMRIHDRIPKGGVQVREQVKDDGTIVFHIDRKGLLPLK